MAVLCLVPTNINPHLQQELGLANARGPHDLQQASRAQWRGHMLVQQGHPCQEGLRAHPSEKLERRLAGRQPGPPLVEQGLLRHEAPSPAVTRCPVWRCALISSWHDDLGDRSGLSVQFDVRGLPGERRSRPLVLVLRGSCCGWQAVALLQWHFVVNNWNKKGRAHCDRP